MIEGAAGCSRYSRSVEAVARTGRASLPAKVGISQQDNKLLWCSLFFLGFRGLQILKFWLSCSLPAKVGIPQQDNKLLWCFFFSVFLDSEGSRYQVGIPQQDNTLNYIFFAYFFAIFAQISALKSIF